MNSNERLLNLINKLKNNNPYFKEYFKDFDINLENIESIYDSLPIINKAEVEHNLREYIVSDFKSELGQDELLKLFHDMSDISWNHDRTIVDGNKKWILETTTGTTGKPFTVLKNQIEKFTESKYLMKCRRNVSDEILWDNGFLLLEPRDEYLKKCFRDVNKKSHFNIMKHLGESEAKWLLATALQIRKLFDSILENNYGEQISRIPIKLVETTSQKLFPDEIESMKKVFKSATFLSQYGCREFWNIAYECKCGKMHVNNDYLRVDLIDDHGKIIRDEGIVGEVIVTSYAHLSMPFFKYYLGDRGKMHYGECECGNCAPWIELQPGRDKQKLVNTDYYGSEVYRKILRYINFHMSYIDIQKIKIIQTEDYKLVVYAVVNEQYKKKFEDEFIKNSIYNIQGFNKFNVEFVYEYPFIDDDRALKNEIFENKLL
ncbi:hypothetical protein [Inconstantimicrobium mannanitabidum]|uniref:Uncharacterized protein n=1 Tax=Inconstantimicrobium mannanitabidum TaxID=1604901 RepID=A0ACB5RH09_9CLOT|nr:hypothetical protein [Clostridium sp. TW13]GKX68381.1 hypothetical protein rsdtw13_36390 [Clostridium sp. TW13]